jgi:HD superfamily phosphodiesterase
MNLTELIVDAQKYLICNPFDLAHDVMHHYRVWAWCFKIVKAEKLRVDWQVLSVAAWWHDAEGRKGKTVTAVKKALENRKLSWKFTNKVISIINQHSYGEKQTTTESKVLFDADKLEYVNPARMLWVKQSFKDGFLTQKQYREYYRYWREKISKVPASMHFAYSRLEYNRMKKQVMENIERYWDSAVTPPPAE